MGSASKPEPPLAGLMVVDLTTFLSGPFATQIMSDLGARVVKVESVVGDSSRSIPPHFVDGESAYYLGANRGKESIALDLKTEAGRDVVTRLIHKADVVIENFRPGVCQRLGIDPARFRKVRPELIWVSISGFGQTGPLSDFPAYDMIVQALSGVMSLTGEEGRPAVRLGIPAGDLVAGMFAVIGALASVVRRKTSGDGALLDISMLDGQLSMLSYQSTYALLSGQNPTRQAAQHDSISTYRSFTGSDGREFVVTANTEQMWARLCDAIELPELADDDRFATQSDRLQNRDDLWRILEGAFSKHPSAEWLQRLQNRRVPAAPINNVIEALDQAADYGRDMVLRLESDQRTPIQVVGDPIKFVDESRSTPSYPPKLGEQSDAILSELGYSVSERRQLQKAGVTVRDIPY